MGLIKAALGAVGSTLADQWKDFLTVPPNIEPTAALFPAVRAGTPPRDSVHTQGTPAILSNGSKVVIPEGYGLLLFQDGELTAFASEPGGYIWDSDDVNSQTIFAGDGLRRSIVTQSWERFKFGGRPGAQQLALFVSLKELPNNKFGTQSEIYWDDAYLNTQVGAITYGTYSVLITDPIVFARRFVPATYLQGHSVFDFTDRSNAAADQLFSEVVSSLAAGFSLYTNDSTRRNRIARIQQDSIGFAEALAEAVEVNYQWAASRGLTISKVSIVGIMYDENTRELLKTVQRADALAGSRGNSNLQASTAAGFEAAGESGGSGGILGMGIAAGSLDLSGLMRPDEPGKESAAPPRVGEDDLVARLEGLKRALDAGLIEQAEYDAAKAKALGLS